MLSLFALFPRDRVTCRACSWAGSQQVPIILLSPPSYTVRVTGVCADMGARDLHSGPYDCAVSARIHRAILVAPSKTSVSRNQADKLILTMVLINARLWDFYE